MVTWWWPSSLGEDPRSGNGEMVPIACPRGGHDCGVVELRNCPGVPPTPAAVGSPKRLGPRWLRDGAQARGERIAQLANGGLSVRGGHDCGVVELRNCPGVPPTPAAVGSPKRLGPRWLRDGAQARGERIAQLANGGLSVRGGHDCGVVELRNCPGDLPTPAAGRPPKCLGPRWLRDGGPASGFGRGPPR